MGAHDPATAVHTWAVGAYRATLKVRPDRTTFVEWAPTVPTFFWREELAEYYAGRMEALEIMARRWPGVAFGLDDPVIERIGSLYERRWV
jgi:hypothetical protein